MIFLKSYLFKKWLVTKWVGRKGFGILTRKKCRCCEERLKKNK